MSNYAITFDSEYLLRAVISALEEDLAVPEELPPLPGGKTSFTSW